MAERERERERERGGGGGVGREGESHIMKVKHKLTLRLVSFLQLSALSRWLQELVATIDQNNFQNSTFKFKVAVYLFSEDEKDDLQDMHAPLRLLRVAAEKQE